MGSNGWKFYLGTREITQNFGSERSGITSPEYVYGPTDTSDEGVTTAWYLDKIITPKGDEINFVYTSSSRRSCSQVSFSESFYKRINFEGGLNGVIVSDLAPENINSFSASMQQTKEVYLQSIIFNNGQVNFLTSNRKDIRPPRSQSYKLPKLGSIEIINPHDKVIKKIDLSYSYFQDVPGGSENTNKLRLRLDQVNEKFWNPTNQLYISKPPYKLEYDSGNLPEKTSFSVDHWGYYNGKSNHNIPHPGYRIPIRKLTPQVLDTDGEVVFPGANRESSFEHMGVGMLKSIQYPTGATAHLNFEPNHIELDGMIVEKTLAFVTDYPLGSATVIQKEKTFVLEEPSRVKLSFSFVNHSYGVNGEENINNISVFDHMIARLEQVSGGVPINFKPDQNIQSYHDIKFVDLPAGTYKLTALTPSDRYFEIQMGATHKVREEHTSIYTLPGMRIQSIDLKDESETMLKRTKYEYTNDSGRSSAKLLSGSSYDYKTFLRGEGENATNWCLPIGTDDPESYCWQATYDVKTSNSVLPLATSASGSPVGYSQVTIKQENERGESLGKSIYYYKNFGEHPQLDSFYPNIPNYVFLDNGQLIKEEHYNRANTLVHLKEYGYKKAALKNIRGLKIYKFQNTQIENRDVKPYNIRSEWWHMDKEIETTFDIHGNHIITDTITYSYENQNHKNITKTIRKNSKSKELVSLNKYALDYSQGSNIVYDKLVEQHMLNTIIEQETRSNNQFISKQHTVYKDWGNNVSENNKLILPEFIQTDKSRGNNSSVNTFEDRIIFNKYDSSGNLLEVSMADGTHTSYIWGYNNEYPIAKIENARYAQVSNYVENLKTKSNIDNDRTVGSIGNEGILRRDLQALRVAFPNAMITTYTYDPLIGITSITDPKGYSTYYEYDIFNRLQYIKDADGNLVSENKYNYKN